MRTSLVVAVLLLILFCVVPVVIVLGDSFVADGGGLTLSHYAEAFGKGDLRGSLTDSLLISTLATLIAVAIGVPFALFSARIRTPLRRLFSALYVLPLVLPPLLMCMGWTLFLRDFRPEGAIGAGPEIFFGGVKGSAILLGLAYFPFVVLFARNAFTEIGGGLEDAARMSVGPWRAFLRVTLPLALPAILAGALFVFLFSLSDFTVVDYLSAILPVSDQVSAYPFKAFWTWNAGNARTATALSVPMAALSLVLLSVIFLLLRRGRHVTVTSSHVRPGDLESGSGPVTRWLVRGGGLLFLAVVFAASVLVPIGRLAKQAGGQDGDLLAHMNRVFTAGDAGLDVANSVVYSLLAAVVMTALAAVLARHVIRKGTRREALVFSLSMLPLVFGPVLFGVGLIRLWNQPLLEDSDRYNVIYQAWPVVIFLLVGKYLPFALAATTSSLRRVDPGYEEAARVSGAGAGRRLLRVSVPLMAKGLAGGFVLAFVFSLREIDTIVMFDAGDRTVMKKIYTWVHLANDANVACLALVLVAMIGVPLLIYLLVARRRLSVM